jgi:hypothetical protein
MPARALAKPLEPAEISPLLHMELETAADIGGTIKQQHARIHGIWQHVKISPHFRAPHHAPRSSHKLITATTLTAPASELHIVNEPDRHKLILDTPALTLWRAGIQARVEIIQKIDHDGFLTRRFKAVVKIGDKAKARIEEDVSLDPSVYAQDGFLKAFREAMKGEGREKEYEALKHQLADALGEEGFSAKKHRIFPVLYLRADTRKTLYSPEDDKSTVLELKTDIVHWETILQQTGEMAQLEIELKYDGGNPRRVKSEIAALCARFDFMRAVTIAKPAPGMEALGEYVVAQNKTIPERLRAEHNQTALSACLNTATFASVDPRQHDFRPA